ncbi:ribose-5-phosphate isomerase RpiA [Candidatus Williamhamiltonella defendens]|uniref:ribose-5-phosphate isomerase RpiA n=1 Tax=Candidatus Williamhamiltonella defendens TaxID=138072 RepID=UPI00130E8968|nr:ribose-5-phosphate isomerase RpiA [Candidatus Hamiltonella defensa]
MTQDEMKKAVSLVALNYVKSDMIIGIGTGSTITHFIHALGPIKERVKGAVSSSEDSTRKLNNIGIPVLDTNEVDIIDIYVDSADAVNHHKQMIKGGGAALTREKVISNMAKKFICIVDHTKKVNILGQFPLPIEVIPMARSYVARELLKLGGLPEYRQGVITDNGHIILDVRHLNMDDPIHLENKINAIAGVVTVGLFARRPADAVLIATSNTVEIME